MNTFDAAVVSVVLVALLGSRAGLLRSLADILGFVIAAPLAVALTPYFSSVAPAVAAGSPWGKTLWFSSAFLLSEESRSLNSCAM
jgi:membrane protein required for colicin V production